MAGRYQLFFPPLSVSTAKTLIQLKTGTRDTKILRFVVSQYTGNASKQEYVGIVRKTTPATVTTAVLGTHIQNYGRSDQGNPGFVLSTSGTGINASSEGTDGDILVPEAFSVLSNRIHVPTVLEDFIVLPGETIGLKFLVAPAPQTYVAYMIVEEA